VSGANARTAVNHAMDGKSQVAGLTAAAVMVVVLCFLTKPLGLLPVAALGAILIVAASGLQQRGIMLGFANFRTEVRAVRERANVTAIGEIDAFFLDGEIC
jgi:MFS superfamily sulfate permease-like transporter